MKLRQDPLLIAILLLGVVMAAFTTVAAVHERRTRLLQERLVAWEHSGGEPSSWRFALAAGLRWGDGRHLARLVQELPDTSLPDALVMEIWNRIHNALRRPLLDGVEVMSLLRLAEAFGRTDMVVTLREAWDGRNSLVDLDAADLTSKLLSLPPDPTARVRALIAAWRRFVDLVRRNGVIPQTHPQARAAAGTLARGLDARRLLDPEAPLPVAARRQLLDLGGELASWPGIASPVLWRPGQAGSTPWFLAVVATMLSGGLLAALLRLRQGGIAIDPQAETMQEVQPVDLDTGAQTITDPAAASSDDTTERPAP